MFAVSPAHTSLYLTLNSKVSACPGQVKSNLLISAESLAVYTPSAKSKLPVHFAQLVSLDKASTSTEGQV
jgi:hypothetical protein